MSKTQDEMILEETFDCAEWWKDRWIRKPRHPGAKEKTYQSIQKGLTKLFLDLKIKTDEKSLIDLGCGTGEMISWFKSQYEMNVAGMEIGKSAIDIVRNKDLYVYDKDVRQAAIDKKFDFVFSSFVSQHMISENDFSGYYQTINNCLKSRGMFILVEYLKSGGFKVNRKFRDFSEHESLWKKYNLKEVMRTKLHPEEGEESWKYIVILRKTKRQKKTFLH